MRGNFPLVVLHNRGKGADVPYRIGMHDSIYIQCIILVETHIMRAKCDLSTQHCPSVYIVLLLFYESAVLCMLTVLLLDVFDCDGSVEHSWKKQRLCMLGAIMTFCALKSSVACKPVTLQLVAEAGWLLALWRVMAG